MQEQWFAIRTKSNREIPVSESLEGKGYEVLCPRYSIPAVRTSARTASPVVRPLFPGYVFCKFDVFVRLPILMIPGVMNVVSNGRIPIPIDDLEVESLKVLVKSKLPLGPHAFLKAGDRVMVSQGPLTGASGYIVETDCRQLVVSITLLQRSVCVRLTREWLEKLPIPGPAVPRIDFRRAGSIHP